MPLALAAAFASAGGIPNNRDAVDEPHRGSEMTISHTIEEISQRIEQAMPESLREGKQEFEKAVRQAVTNGFSRMDLVTREEFDVQTQVLARTRAKLEALEQRVNQLEKRLDGSAERPEPEEGDIAS